MTKNIIIKDFLPPPKMKKKTKEILYWIAVAVGAIASVALIIGIIIELIKIKT